MTEANTIKSEIYAAIAVLIDDETVSIKDETPLIGGESLLDSMRLVELCLALEDKAYEMGFEFDWTSEAAMSRSRGMFRTAETLAAEFVNQMKAQK